MTVSSPLSFFTFRSEVIVEIAPDGVPAGACPLAAKAVTRLRANTQAEAKNDI
ncbi:MAG: hypothetical protein IPL32_00575 [Chloracidobacterium sp.]|nr:hypothetical protein [Acidobacteriota bacterium]MBK8464300.1 hypothetical protein [Chloracidobacterium sp.]